jgi:biotin-dependent carboxylase-like uncharacterized protein
VITVVAAPPFATVQDLGRTGYRSEAVPPGGALDRAALVIGNRLVGNDPGEAALEWARGAGEIRFEAPALVALTGAEGGVQLNGRLVPAWTTLAVRPGDALRVGDFERGAWLYVCVRGGIAVPLVLGSRSTLVPARLGGIEGRPLRSGDVLRLGESARDAPPPGTTTRPRRREWQDGAVPLLPGPARAGLRPGEWDRLLATELRVSSAVSRMGYRLEGPAFEGSFPADLPSAPTCPGALQLPPQGTPIVLLQDGPTVGGYPIVGVVPTVSVGELAQRRSGMPVRFKEIGFDEARALLTTERAGLASGDPSG